jgi:hypothetical protein
LIAEAHRLLRRAVAYHVVTLPSMERSPLTAGGGFRSAGSRASLFGTDEPVQSIGTAGGPGPAIKRPAEVILQVGYRAEPG